MHVIQYNSIFTICHKRFLVTGSVKLILYCLLTNLANYLIIYKTNFLINFLLLTPYKNFASICEETDFFELVTVTAMKL